MEIKRVGLVTIAETLTKVIGDPHLGRRFVNGVPLHRRGEREEMVFQQFEKEMKDVQGAEVVVIVGDLFDKFVVPPEVVLRTATALRSGASANLDTSYVVLRGNHDGSRDADRASSFDLFHHIVSGASNIHIAVDEPLVHEHMLFLPWHPFKSAKEMLAEAPQRKYGAIFGHWDTVYFSDEPPANYLPHHELSDLTRVAITGHEHKPTVKHFGDLEVVITGSMQPYANGEELEGEMYVTVPCADLKAGAYTDKCLRVLLGPDDELPQDIDCLQLVIKRVTEEKEEEAEEVKLDDFDFDALMKEVFEEAGVEPDVLAEVQLQYKTMKTGGE